MLEREKVNKDFVHDCLKVFFLVFTSLKMRGNSKNYHFLEGKSSKSSLQILPYSTREKFSAKFLLDAKVTRSQ